MPCRKQKEKVQAIAEAEKINLTDHHLYHALLGELYCGLDNKKALGYLQQALALAKSVGDKNVISNKISKLTNL
jgi:RNA polymerase sigma-70 factor (ECF subfamily)